MVDEPKEVLAVATMTAANASGNWALAQALEDAMVAAIHQAIEDGVSLNDTETLLKYKADARERTIEEFENGGQ